MSTPRPQTPKEKRCRVSARWRWALYRAELAFKELKEAEAAYIALHGTKPNAK